MTQIDVRFACQDPRDDGEAVLAISGSQRLLKLLENAVLALAFLARGRLGQGRSGQQCQPNGKSDAEMHGCDPKRGTRI